jgi:trigger factor
MIAKMYRGSILGEELNKIITDNLYKYIDQEKLMILGSPLPSDDKDQQTDLATEGVFKFKYDLGMSPQFQVNVSDKEKFDQYTIKIDDELIAKYSKDIRRRYGKVAKVEVSGEEDLLSGKFEELDSKGELVNGGISHGSTIAVEFIDDEKIKKTLQDLKVGDAVTVDPHKVSKGDSDMAKMLGIRVKDVPNVGNKFRFTVNEIYNMNPADENQELFDKFFGPGKVNSPEEFKAEVAKILEDKLKIDADRKLLKDITDRYMEKLKLPLPDAFLKRWLHASNEGKFSHEQIAEEYEDYTKSLRWQLIESQIIKENDIRVERPEVMEFTKNYVREQLAQYGELANDEVYLEQSANEILKKEENMRDIYQQVLDRKLMQLYKEKFSLKTKEVTFDEFVKIATGKASKSNMLDKLTNLVKF